MSAPRSVSAHTLPANNIYLRTTVRTEVQLIGKENSLHFVLFVCSVIFVAVWMTTIINGPEDTGAGRLSDKP